MNRKNNLGITLISLIVTVIVLLILAGAGISMLIGNNGILTYAKESREKIREANAKERVQLEVQASYGEDGRINIELLNENLKRIKGLTYKGAALSDTNKIEKDNFTVEVELDGYKIKIYENGDVRIESLTKEDIIMAEMVLFTPQDTNWQVQNVKQALDYLYNN